MTTVSYPIRYLQLMLTEMKFNVKPTTHASYDFNIPATYGNASGLLIHIGMR